MTRQLVLFPIMVALLLVLAGCPSMTGPAPAGTPAGAEDTPTEAAAEEITPTIEITETLELTPTQELTPTEGLSPTEGVTSTEGITPTEGLTSTAEANVVQVSLVDGAIEMPATVPAGPTTFEVTNNGTTEHSFEVAGQGIEEELAQELQPGDMQMMEVDLQPGTYEVYCPVDNHRAEGMEVELTVTE